MEKSISQVAIIRSNYRSIRKNIARVFELIDYKPQKKDILIKPNLVDEFPPKSGIITSPLIVEAIIRHLKESFPGTTITIGEGSALHTTLKKVLAKSGYLEFEKKYGVSFVDFNQAPRVPYTWSKGKLLLPEILNTHEYINVPKMKTHLQTHVSLAMKNQKGLLSEKDKKNFHRKYGLFESIRELSQVIQPDLNIIDGITGLEGNGPLQHGTVKRNVNLVVASKDIVACDNVAARLMGYEVDEIGYIPEINHYETLGEKIPACITPFKRPIGSPMNRMNVTFYFNETMCSICAIMVDQAFKLSLNNLPFFCKLATAGGMTSQKHIIVGNLPTCHDDRQNVFCVGNCTLDLAKSSNLYAVPGCPPDPAELREQYLNFCKNSNSKLFQKGGAP